MLADYIKYCLKNSFLFAETKWFGQQTAGIYSDFNKDYPEFSMDQFKMLTHKR